MAAASLRLSRQLQKYPNSVAIHCRPIQGNGSPKNNVACYGFSTQSQAKATPRPSNPSRYRKGFQVRNDRRPTEFKGLEKRRTVALQLERDGRKVAASDWVQIDGIPPISSLGAITKGVENALNTEAKRGIINVDATWDPILREPIPFLPKYSGQWISQAQIELSPFGRPKGWFLQLPNRSIAHALLTYAAETPVLCAWKPIIVRSVTYEKVLEKQYPEISDATLRVENCPAGLRTVDLANFFARYDLAMDRQSIVRWEGVTPDGKPAPDTFFVHFADASWARAALREKQNAKLFEKALRLAQFPKQLLLNENTEE